MSLERRNIVPCRRSTGSLSTAPASASPLFIAHSKVQAAPFRDREERARRRKELGTTAHRGPPPGISARTAPSSYAEVYAQPPHARRSRATLRPVLAQPDCEGQYRSCLLGYGLSA